MNLLINIYGSICLIMGLAASSLAEEIVIKPYQTGTERRLDNPVDAWMTAWPGAAGTAVITPDKLPGDIRRYQILSNDSRNGDASITFTVVDPAKQSAFGLTSGKFIDRWEVGAEATLHLWLKLDAKGSDSPIKVVLYDVAGKNASFPVTPRPTDKTWQVLDIPLKKFTAAEGFDFTALRSVQLEAVLPKGAQVWLDDVYFHQGDSHLGVSDKTITQYMAEVAATRAKRTDTSMQRHQKTWGAFWRGDLVAANQELKKELEEQMDKETTAKGGSQLYNPLGGYHYPIYYLAFSSKGRFKPGSLTPEVEELLLRAMKINDLLVNDIALARHSTWNIIHSENHDYNKIKALLYSQIFMHEPKYAALIYPNKGASLEFQTETDQYMPWIKTYDYATSDQGNYKDGGKYTAKDHCQAWSKYFKEYIAERARCGFFNEQNAAGTYGLCPAFFFNWLYVFAEDEDLRKQTRMFLDLMYAKWLQDQMVLIQGGEASRGGPGRGSLWQAAAFYMGGAQCGDIPMGDYEWPRAVWEMALDRKGRGEYAYVSRRPNESRDSPRPEGTGSTFLLRRDSRLARYSWVTPDYAMGVRMDYPNALYAHIFKSASGISFPTSEMAAIQFNLGLAYRAAQDRNVALMQQKHYISIEHPPYFGNYTAQTDMPMPSSVLFSKDVDHIEEKEGWVFAQEGNAYVAVRVISAASNESLGRDARGFSLLPLAKDNYELAQTPAARKIVEGTTLKAKQPKDPLVVEVSRTAHHATLADFQKDVLDNPLVLKTKNPVFGNMLSYRGCGADARELYLNLMNDETPRIDGKSISYDPPAFDSPWIKGAFDSGVVTLIGPISGIKTVLDFNKFSVRESQNKPNDKE